MPTVTARPIFEQFVSDTADHYVDPDAELGLTEAEARRVRSAYRRAFNVYEANHLGCLAEHAEIAGLKAAHAELAKVHAERKPISRAHTTADELWWAMTRDAEERGPRRVIRASQVAKRWMSGPETDGVNDHAGSFVGHGEY